MNTPDTSLMPSETMRPDHPTLPNVEKIDYRYARGRVGFDRDASWLEMVRRGPCMECGAPGPSDPHHVFGSYMAAKTSDYATIPLCRRCHEEYERDSVKHNRGVMMLSLFLTRTIASLYAEET